jgi:SAM-dependent methyltransferase
MPAFDALAPTYDSDFTSTPIARYLRERAHERLNAHFGAGDTVLELGCGTGEDALRLAQRGVRVVATDSSPLMLDAARAKTAGEPGITVARLDLRALPPIHDSLGAQHETPLSELNLFDGVFSNFGPLNCLDNWRPLAAWLAARVKPGGVAAFGVMSPFCLWEMVWHGLHGDWRTAIRRLGGGAAFKPDDADETLIIHYPTVRRLTHDFAPYFRRARVLPLGVFLPPSDVYGVAERRPRLLRTLLALEQQVRGLDVLALAADHYWIEFRRV